MSAEHTDASTNATSATPASAAAPAAAPTDFIRDIVAEHVAQKRYPKIITRFPPEPNGYLHLGHAKSICLNFGIALENGGICNLRMDDTNPAKEEVEYVESITEDVQWLIAGWASDKLGLTTAHAHPAAAVVGGKLDYHLGAANQTGDSGLRTRDSGPGTLDAGLSPFFASDYFDALYAYAEQLILKGKAYVCDLAPDQVDEYRGSPDRPGKPSPWRDRPADENLDLFRRMRAGEFPDGARTLRARIDMASPNIWLRDPLLYRIRHTAHHHAGDNWRVYPLYDYAHCLSDYIEGITHSICTLEFEVHRPLYDWILEALDLPRPLPRQYEFAKLNLAYTLFSKRRLMRLVKENHVAGWDDPRMPTIAGIRRRGIPAAAVRHFAYNIGVTKYDSLTETAVYENAIRDELNATALRRMAVLRPIKLVLTNIPAGEAIECRATNHPANPALGTRPVALTREVYIEADDFAEVPPPKYFRLKPGGEVRLKYACIIKLDEIVKDADGKLLELRCTADLTTRAGQPNVDRKVKGTIHWVSAAQSLDAEVRLYDRLFTVPEPGADDDFIKHLNPKSVEVVTAKLEPSLADAARASAETRYQFERLGYFALDAKASSPAVAATAASASSAAIANLVFNRAITLKDTWAK